MKAVADLLQGIASVLWPILVFVLVVWFKPEIANILKRIKRGKFLGQEVELDEDLSKLNREAIAAASEIAALPIQTEEEPLNKANFTHALKAATSQSEILKLLDLADSSPKIALMSLAIEIEKELREIIFSQGQVGRPYNFTMANAINILEERGALPAHTIQALHSFRKVRNKIVHGSDSAATDEILRAIDSGGLILWSLKSIPRMRVYVYHPGVTVYSDRDATQPIEGIRGVILEMINSETGGKNIGIYPTTRTHFVKGKQVAWEWVEDNRWGDAWYRDSDTGDIKLAWNSSVEFVGRNFDET